MTNLAKHAMAVAAIAVILLRLSAALAQNGALFEFREKPGPFAVGLRITEQYDRARVFRKLTNALGKPEAGERARPLQTLIWYPAKAATSPPMTVGDYNELMATEVSFDDPHFTEHAKRRMAGMAPSLTSKLWAHRDAPAVAGHFPVVIYAPGASGSAFENVDLCEYLASHGYVVIASPSMGEKSRGMTIDAAGANSQAADISFLIGYAQGLPDTDMSAVGVASFSFGGLSSLVAASRDNRIDALVSLDGSQRYYPALVQKIGIIPQEMTIPLLYFSEGEISLEDQVRHFAEVTQGPSVLNDWQHGDLLTVHMLPFAHVEFSAMSQRNEDMWKDATFKDDYDRQDGITGYGWVARYTLQFLDAYLKHSAGAQIYLTKAPKELGAPDHFIVTNFRAADGVPASIDTFRASLGREGFAHASDVYASMQAADPGFKLEEVPVEGWASELISTNHVPEAVALLQLNARNYPESSDAYERLGEAYMKAGQAQLAINNFNKSLAKDSGNTDSSQYLRALGASGAAVQ